MIKLLEPQFPPSQSGNNNTSHKGLLLGLSEFSAHNSELPVSDEGEDKADGGGEA